MKKFFMGVILGAGLCISLTTFAAPVKQFILTQITYPFIVNDVAYKDDKQPILNYNGATYVPLAKLGDLTGVKYKWNTDKKQVEISAQLVDTSPGPIDNGATQEPTPKPSASPKSTPNVDNKEPKGLVQEEGRTVFYAYDRDDVFIGIYTDEDNSGRTVAQIEKRPIIPPSLSEGWIWMGFFTTIYDAYSGFKDLDYVIRPVAAESDADYITFPLTEEFKASLNGTIVSNGVRINKYDGSMYVNIADLQKAGLVQ